MSSHPVKAFLTSAFPRRFLVIIYFLTALLAIIILGLLSFDLVVVLLSYSIFWYEAANKHSNLIEKRFGRKNLQLVASLISSELFYDLLALSSIPFGLIKKKNPFLKRGETPVLLLHGLFVNKASWFWFKYRLKQQGFNNVITMNLSSWHNEEVLTELVAKKVDELRHQVGVNKINIIGHSMGGLIARNYIQLRGGSDKVEQLICLGSPHHGSKLATFTLDPLGKLLIPNSDFLQRLNQSPVPVGVITTNIYTSKDNMVLPNESCRITWAKNIVLDRMGHTALIYRKSVLTATVTALKQVTQKG